MANSHSLALRHHFSTAEQQKECSTLGMWMFLVTEIMFFGGMFTAYVVYRHKYFPAFAAASNSIDIVLGAVNTAVLLLSSFTMVMAVHSAKVGKRGALVLFLILTIALGSVFLIIKAIEWHDKFVEHHVPGASFHFEGSNAPGLQLFFSLYFGMTGLHALHMVIGVGMLLYFTIKSAEGAYSAEYYTPIDVAGLYWHFVDIVWIFLFPLLYLIDRSGA